MCQLFVVKISSLHARSFICASCGSIGMMGPYLYLALISSTDQVVEERGDQMMQAGVSSAESIEE